MAQTQRVRRRPVPVPFSGQFRNPYGPQQVQSAAQLAALATDQVDTDEHRTRQLRTIPFLDGVLHEALTINAGAQARIYHGLRRQPRGWWLTDLTSAGALNENDVRRVDWNDQYLTLANDATSSVTISLWIF